MAGEKRFIPRIDGFAIDAIESESHERASDITQIPVEDGADVSDNITLQNRRATIQGLVTDTPSGDMIAERNLTQDEAVITTQAACDTLESAWEQKRTVTVETEFKTYKAMVIKSLVMPRDSKTGRALKFTVQFEEIRIRQTVRKTILLRSDVRAVPKKKVAQKPPAPVGPTNKLVGPTQKGDRQVFGRYIEAQAAGYKGTEGDFITDNAINMMRAGATQQQITASTVQLNQEAYVHEVAKAPVTILDSGVGQFLGGVIGGGGSISAVYKNEFDNYIPD